MFDQTQLNEAEKTLIVELLEREEQELPVEIHHTRSANVKEELHQRLELVRGLLGRVRAGTAV